MLVERLIVGQLQTNCYLVYERQGGECFIIDPGDDADFIIRKIKDLDLEPKAILATHGHFDHILGAAELKLAFKIPFYLNAKDAKILKRTQSTAKYFTGLNVDPVPKINGNLYDKQLLQVAGCKLQVISTPGHTRGSLTFLGYGRGSKMLEKAKGRRRERGIKAIFSGDLIFAGGSYGRTDLEGGDEKKLKQSIKKILSLPENTIIYPGHGEPTTIKGLTNVIRFW